MKKTLLYSSALTVCMVAVPVYTAHAAIVTTTTRTYTYEFPTSTPVTSENVSTVTDCPVSYGGGGGGGGGGGSGYDVNGDGVGDYGSRAEAEADGHTSGTQVGNHDNPYGQDVNSCGNCGGGGGGGGGGGCFLTTAVVTVTGEADDGPTLTKMRHLRDHYVTGTRDGMERIDVYYLLAPEIVRRVNIRPDARDVWKGLFNDWIAPIGKMVDQEQWLEADRTYSAMLHELVGRYLLSDYHRMPADFKAALDESIAFRSV